MKTDYNKALIYDDNCPLCKAYTSAFVKGGFLKKENRISFSEVNIHQFNIDWHRAKHEIPVINLTTGEVKYGVDALADILCQKFFFIDILLKVKVLNCFFRNLYKLISYNRKIIVAAQEQQSATVDCTPDYSFFWRWLLIVICYSLSNFFIIKSAALLFEIHKISLTPFVSVCWMLLPLLTSMFCSKKMATEIHAHVSVITTITGFLLIITSCFAKYFYTTPFILYLMLSMISVITLLQCKRRYSYILNFSKR